MSALPFTITSDFFESLVINDSNIELCSEVGRNMSFNYVLLFNLKVIACLSERVSQNIVSTSTISLIVRGQYKLLRK